MAKRIFYNDDARARVLKGAKTIYDAVKVTYGPKGRNVVIGRDYTTPIYTHDGVTVAQSIDLPIVDDDTLGQNVGVEMIKQAASNLNKTGDGTTSVTILTYNILADACRLIAADYNPQELRSQIECQLPALIKELDKMTEKIESTDIKRVAEIATISAEDPAIGAMIADLIAEIGKDGVVSVEVGKGRETTPEIVEGYTYDKGYSSPFFITDITKQEAFYEDVAVIIINTKLDNLNQIADILTSLLAKNRRRVLIICDDMTPDTLSLLCTNKQDNNIDVVVAKAPGYGAQRTELLEDIAILTGATVITDFETIDIGLVGAAAKVIVTKNSTTIIGKKELANDVEARVNSLKSQANLEESDYEKERYQKRIASLTGKIAIIKIGGASESEIEERKYRVDDAVAATKAALAEGIVAGGCTTFVNLAKFVPETTPGSRILKKALRQPFLQLMENSSLNGQAMLYKLDKSRPGFGYDVNNALKLVDMKASGIIDPTLVIKEVLSNAVSIASVAVTMGALIVDIPEKPLEYRD